MCVHWKPQSWKNDPDAAKVEYRESYELLDSTVSLSRYICGSFSVVNSVLGPQNGTALL